MQDSSGTLPCSPQSDLHAAVMLRRARHASQLAALDFVWVHATHGERD